MTGPGVAPPAIPPVRHRPHRVISVHLETLAIQDGHTALPVVGKHAALVLGFREADSETSPQLVSVHRVWAEPASSTPPSRGKDWSGRVRDDPPRWRTRLTADRWAATWHADRPVVGELELRGTITGDWSYGVPELTRGRVLRVRRVTQTRHRTGPGPGDWQEDPEQTVLTDLDPTDTVVGFESGLGVGPKVGDGPYHSMQPPERVWTYDSGLLVDLDLDDLPTRPLRPLVVPGALAVHGPDVWVLDARLPLLVHLRHGVVVGETTWRGVVLAAEQTREGRRVHADATGCWITGPDGVHRADLDGAVRTVTDEPAFRTVATTTGLLAVPVRAEDHDGAETLLLEPDGGSLAVHGAPRSLVPDEHGFVGTGPRPIYHLVRVHDDGRLEPGPVLPSDQRGGLSRGDGPIWYADTLLRAVRADLSLGLTMQTTPPGRVKTWWSFLSRVFAFGTPPPDIVWDPDIGYRMALTEVDPRTGTTVSTAIVPTPEIRDLAPDDTGDVWAVGAGQLLRCRGTQVDRIDVAALLAAHRAAHLTDDGGRT